MRIATARNHLRMPIEMFARADCALELDGLRVCVEMRERDLLHKILIFFKGCICIAHCNRFIHSFARFQRELHNSNRVVRTMSPQACRCSRIL